MKIAVLNGSPKGEVSVTVQYIRFIQKKYPEHEFKLLNIAHDILKIEKKNEAFLQIIDEVKTADGVIWAFPLYVFLVASQYKRFIELIWERKAAEAFRGKYACALSTSIHFFDNTAHNYIRGICDDLGMKFTESFSADMDDLFGEDKRRILLKWAGDFIKAIENKKPTAVASAPVVAKVFTYEPGKPAAPIAAGGLKIRVLTDAENPESNISRMVKRFCGAVQGDVQAFAIQDIDIKGGCLGCLECAFDNECVYKDGFVDFFEKMIRSADVILYAGEIRDRFLSARTKMVWDRRFYKGHIPPHIGKQVGFIVSGPLAQLANLQEILQAHAEMSGGNLAGIVTDEAGDSAVVDGLIDHFAARCADYAQAGYMRPKTFLGVGGHKIFRDQIWSRLRFPFDADYRFMAAHGMFDFPQNDARYLQLNEKMIGMIQDPKMRETVRKMIKTEMLRGYRKIVETK